MRVKAKTIKTGIPLWAEGEYITNPPIRPSDGAQRPQGHYVDKGGYPGANVYEIDTDTLCRQTAAADRKGKAVFENDYLLYEPEEGEEIGYLLVMDEETAVDIINGEIISLAELPQEDIQIIGNRIDYPDFTEGMQYHIENGLGVPYLPALSVQETVYPYLSMHCTKCGKTMLSCCYMVKHKDCGGYLTADFATKIYRERQKEKALA